LGFTHYYYSHYDSLPLGTHRMKIVVYSENSSRLEQLFQLDWSGVWTETEEEMFRQS
jgi:hypothetical protein